MDRNLKYKPKSATQDVFATYYAISRSPEAQGLASHHHGCAPRWRRRAGSAERYAGACTRLSVFGAQVAQAAARSQRGGRARPACETPASHSPCGGTLCPMGCSQARANPCRRTSGVRRAPPDTVSDQSGGWLSANGWLHPCVGNASCCGLSEDGQIGGQHWFQALCPALQVLLRTDVAAAG